MDYNIDVSLYIVWRVPPCAMVDTFVKYIVVGRSNSPPPLAVVYFKIVPKGVPYICMVGTFYYFLTRAAGQNALEIWSQ